MIIAIDPGPVETGWAVMDGKLVTDSGVINNGDLESSLRNSMAKALAYEMIASYGMPVGASVFDTCVWIGRFISAFGPERSFPVFRKDVTMHLCNSTRAKDANVRQAIIDLYEGSGGGSIPQIGTKKYPGPLYGVSRHAWPAIGVGLTYQAANK